MNGIHINIGPIGEAIVCTILGGIALNILSNRLDRLLEGDLSPVAAQFVELSGHFFVLVVFALVLVTPFRDAAGGQMRINFGAILLYFIFAVVVAVFLLRAFTPMRLFGVLILSVTTFGLYGYFGAKDIDLAQAHALVASSIGYAVLLSVCSPLVVRAGRLIRGRAK